MIVSKTRGENYVSYLLIELILLFVITFIGTGLIVFYGLLFVNPSGGGLSLKNIFDNPLIYTGICVAPALVTLFFALHSRNRSYIVGFRFDDEREELELMIRNLRASSLHTVRVPYTSIFSQRFAERRILFNARYQGIRLFVGRNRYDFVANNFIWETQPRERIAFTEQLEQIGSEF